jgi:hypothetical protein
VLSDAENSINNGLGMYVWAVKRRGDGDFNGSVLSIDRGLGYEQMAVFEREATYGVTASTLTASTSVHDIVADALTVDLHTEDTLESVTTDELRAGANAAIVGSEVVQILEAEREPDTVTYPNRWYLTIGLRARRGTDFAIDTHSTGERFVLINNALQFVPMAASEIGVERDYLMLAAGQSQDDGAVMQRVFEGGSVKHLAPVNVRRHDDADFNSLVEWDERLRLGHGLYNGLSGFADREREIYDVEIFSDGTRATVAHSATVEGLLGEEVRLDDYSDIDSFGLPTNSRAVGRQRLPYDESFASARFTDVQSVISSFGVVDVVGLQYPEAEDGSRTFGAR